MLPNTAMGGATVPIKEVIFTYEVILGQVFLTREKRRWSGYE